jgi:hypothetical protein
MGSITPATAAPYQAIQDPRLVEGTRAEEQAESTVQRTAETSAAAAGAASKAANNAASKTVDTYA